MPLHTQATSESHVSQRPLGEQGDRRAGRDRRSSDRRSNVYPLESRETRLRFAAQAAGFGTFDVDCTTGNSVWSPELKAMAGLDQNGPTLSTEEAESFIHPDDRPRFLEKLRSAMDPESSGEFDDEHRLVRPDGTICWVKTKGRTFFIDQGGCRRPLATTGVVMDITASRTAAQALTDSQEELDKMVETAIDAIVTIDADQRIIRFNPSAARMFGCPAEEALGSRVERFMPERYRASHEAHVRRFAEGPTPAQTLESVQRRFTGLRANGEEFPFEATITKVRMDGNSRMTTFMRDITDRVRAEEALRQSKEDLEMAVRGANIGIWRLDVNTRKVEWSGRTYQLFGLPEGEPIDYDRMMAAIHPDDREKIHAAAEQALQKRQGYYVEYRVVWPDGSLHWQESVGGPVYGEDGSRPVGFHGVTLDVTRRKLAEETLRHRKEDLELAIRGANIGIWRSPSLSADTQWAGEMEWSGRTFELFGLSPSSKISMELIKALIYPDDLAVIFAETQRAMATGDEYHAEYRVIWPDGSLHWLESVGRLLYDDNRKAVGMHGVTIDITRRKIAEEALRRSKEDLELAVRGASLGVWTWDVRTAQFELSERCHQLFGIPPGEPSNQERVFAALHPDDRERAREALRKAVEEAAEYKIDKRFIWPDGSLHWVECIGRGLFDEKGKAVGIRGIALEITERKRQEEALQHSKEDLEVRVEGRTAELIRANEALERSNLELQQFAFIAAHDLQTPLRSISGFAQLLQKDYRGRLSAEADTWLTQLIRSVRRMNDVIRDILEYSRVDSRGSAFQPVDLDQLFDDVAVTLEAPMRETGAQVTRGDLPTVTGDRTQLAQVLQNLIENSLKYRSEEPPRIHVSARRQEHEWVISVQDNGIGIGQKHLASIFDIFRRLHTEQEYPGTGIGLAICRRVIHRHGGRIWAESTPGRGSTFYFSLPDQDEGRA